MLVWLINTQLVSQSVKQIEIESTNDKHETRNTRTKYWHKNETSQLENVAETQLTDWAKICYVNCYIMEKESFLSK